MLYQLSYAPMNEPPNVPFGMNGGRGDQRGVEWWAWVDSNHRPLADQANALTS